MKKGDIKLSINRLGEFSILPEQFSNAQCGINEKVDYKYEVRIEATDKRFIEPEQFILDNMVVKSYFDQTYGMEKKQVNSCEVMACDAITYFKSLFTGKNAIYPFIDLRRIKVKISGSNQSFIEGEWSRK